LAAGEGAHRYVLGPAVSLLISRGVRLRLLSTDRDETLAAVREGRANLGVTVAGALPAGLKNLDLATYPQVAVLPSGHHLGRRRSLRVADLLGETMIVPPPGRPQREALGEAWRRAGAGIVVGAEAEGWAQVLYFASLGAGIGVVNGCVGAVPGTVTRPVRDLPAVAYCAVFRKAEEGSPGLRSVLESLQASLP
ncbi:MAG TPA: substrate-binding domain-containing protein, partial [Acidimicrobiales bacterium]|nr:substrate-binding domain-containing protein [Acidimicrobiales bacterium]